MSATMRQILRPFIHETSRILGSFGIREQRFMSRGSFTPELTHTKQKTDYKTKIKISPVQSLLKNESFQRRETRIKIHCMPTYIDILGTLHLDISTF